MTAFVAPHADDWRVFHGEASPAEARVYVSLMLPDAAAPLTLSGVIHGPKSRYARTLPSSTRFKGTRRDAELLAEVILPDPCCWSPAAPYLYTAEVQLESDGHVLWQDTRLFGIRRLGARGQKLYLDAQNWVLRGGFVSDTSDFSWEDWREHDLAAVVTNPTEAFCAEADQRGLLIVAALEADAAGFANQMRSYQRHPSVGMVLAPAQIQLPADARALAPNALFAAKVDEYEPVPDWADVVWRNAAPSISEPSTSLPEVIARPGAERSPAVIRAACDALQRDAVRLGDRAGYAC
jgi:hypothetical protein